MGVVGVDQSLILRHKSVLPIVVAFGLLPSEFVLVGLDIIADDGAIESCKEVNLRVEGEDKPEVYFDAGGNAFEREWLRLFVKVFTDVLRIEIMIIESVQFELPLRVISSMLDGSRDEVIVGE